MGSKIKSKSIEKAIPLADLPMMAESIAALITGAPSSLSEALETPKWKKLKLELKRKGDDGEVRLSMKMKPQDLTPNEDDKDESGEGEAPPSKPSYKKLKKTMDKQFTVLKRAAKSGELPPGDVVESFLSNSLEMVSFPDKGEELYTSYTGACAELQQAYNEKDPARFSAALEKIDGIKEEAHDQYK